MNKIYFIPGYKTDEEVQHRINELNIICGNRDIHYTSYPIGTEFALVVPKVYLGSLSEDEQKRAQLLESRCPAVPYSPNVFRFMDEQYIDKFMATGELRLTTFDGCGALSDPLRMDRTEGRIKAHGVGKTHSYEAEMKIGYTAYILCASLSNKAKRDDGTYYKYALEILDTVQFMNAIANALFKKGILLKQVIAGPCAYSEKIIEQYIPDDKIVANMNNLEGIFSLGTLAAGPDVYFRKNSEKREEHEYRMVFDTTKEVKDHITIFIPEMIPYCRKRVFSW